MDRTDNYVWLASSKTGGFSNFWARKEYNAKSDFNVTSDLRAGWFSITLLADHLQAFYECWTNHVYDGPIQEVYGAKFIRFRKRCIILLLLFVYYKITLKYFL